MLFRDFLKKNIVFLDGGTGTLLQQKGLKAGERTEEWNLTHPDIIKGVHLAYLNAGSNVISTNTFGANGLKYDGEKLTKIITSAIDIAKSAIRESTGKQKKFVAFDIGPTGRLLKPFGDLDFEDAVNVFKQEVKIALSCGVDLFLIETFNDGYEGKAALLAVKELTDLPVLISNAYSEDKTLITGGTPKSVSVMYEGMGADGVGANCSLGPNRLEGVITELLDSISIPVLFKPNAGLPKEIDGKTVFDVDKESFALSVKKTVEKGVRIIGGCCGTTPEYIKELKKVIGNIKPKKIEKKETTVVSSSKMAVEFNKKAVIIGERINPTGKKLFQKALKENDIDYILKEGISEQESGANILDVNVGIPEINEEEVLPSVIFSLQSVVDIPLQIDTSNYQAMEKALRIYNGKPLLNSVNGKKESMEKVFPLAKKYGASIICLTLDEKGIPNTVGERIAIAEKIIKTAKAYGIDKKDLIFDALTLSVAVDKNAGNVTLQTVKELTEKLNVNTTLGISNVSFGLPERDKINSTFLTLALKNGLSSAIVNPFSLNIMSAFKSFNAVSGIDENCNDFINYANSIKVEEKQVKSDKDETLENAIIKGLKDSAKSITEKLLKEKSAQEIIEKEIIPALDIVGKGYEEKKVYLPQLLISAESAKSAFSVIEENSLKENKTENKIGTVVLATVKGDVHDIGKNIVKMMLNNYGFSVIDLGKDVDKERVLKIVKECNAKVLGLSALMTTTLPAMAETVSLIKSELPNCNVVVGGAVLTKEYADKIGADCFARTAMETVRFAQKTYEK